MLPPANTAKTVQMKYAYEDAMRLADDLVTAQEFALAGYARSFAIEILQRWEEEAAPDAAGGRLYSVRVPR